MKQLSLIIATLFALNITYAQSYDLIYTNGESSLTALQGNDQVSQLNFQKGEEGTLIGVDYSGINGTTTRMVLISNGTPVYETSADASAGGPSIPPVRFETKEVVYDGIVSVEQEDWIFTAIATAIVLCCVEAQVGSNGWSVAFDCDCFGSMAAPAPNGGGITVQADGQTFENITAMQFIPVDGMKDKLNGASITNRD
ncbi:MAG: hypothetical protein MI974_04680 [Chitinophagales bacterium]|nr:hypothetical protein [Chitinophagales bacterium]